MIQFLNVIFTYEETKAQRGKTNCQITQTVIKGPWPLSRGAMGSHQRVLSTSDTMRLMFPKDDSDKNKLDMPPYAQPLLAPFVPKIKMFTFRNFMDIESEINDCSEVTIQIILAKMLCSGSEEVGKGGMASSPRSLCYLGTAFHKFTRGCEQEGYGRHSASRSRGTVNAPLTPPALTEHYASSSVILI